MEAEDRLDLSVHALRANGFTNRDLRNKLSYTSIALDPLKQSAQMTLLLRRLRAHGLIAKIPPWALLRGSKPIFPNPFSAYGCPEPTNSEVSFDYGERGLKWKRNGSAPCSFFEEEGPPMKVSDLMHEDVKSCTIDDRLNTAARQMWENDCGCVPVLDENSRVVGMVTDRDICMAGYFQNRPLSDIRITDAMSNKIFSCRSADAIETAEKTMRENQIRRLPVIDDGGRLLGILSLNDIALEAERQRRLKGRKEVKSEEVAATLAAVCDPNRGAAGASSAG